MVWTTFSCLLKESGKISKSDSSRLPPFFFLPICAVFAGFSVSPIFFEVLTSDNVRYWILPKSIDWLTECARPRNDNPLTSFEQGKTPLCGAFVHCEIDFASLEFMQAGGRA